MPKTAKLNQLSALKVRAYMEKTDDKRPLHDGGGLYLRKRASGSAFWYLRMTEPGTKVQQWHSLFPGPGGAYPHRSLADARVEAARLRSIHSQGIDPRAQRARLQAEEKVRKEAALAEAARRLTLRQLFDEWKAAALKPHIRTDGKRTGRKDGGAFVEAQFERYLFPTLGNMVAKDVRKADLLKVFDAQKTSGRVRTAQILWTDLRAMFFYALDRELVDADPLATLKKSRVVGTSVERDRALSEAEIVALHAAMPAARLTKRTEAAVWLLLSTAVRIGELAGATWSDPLRSTAEQERLQAMAEAANIKYGVVDPVARTWHLPDTKNQQPHTIHLSDFALKQFSVLLADRAALSHTSGQQTPWVFPARDTRKPLDARTLGKQFADRQRETTKRRSACRARPELRRSLTRL